MGGGLQLFTLLFTFNLHDSGGGGGRVGEGFGGGADGGEKLGGDFSALLLSDPNWSAALLDASEPGDALSLSSFFHG